MLIIRLFSLLGLILIVGCASSPEKIDEPEESKAQGSVSDSKIKDQTKEVKTAIAPDVMYMLLAAELAGQRGQYEIAL
ncbi:MAG: hypothetical protein U1E01_25460, partial [Methylicorpusculum sp.]|nr:hypothetical protein [Methylicorpusculum sp.]